MLTTATLNQYSKKKTWAMWYYLIVLALNHKNWILYDIDDKSESEQYLQI